MKKILAFIFLFNFLTIHLDLALALPEICGNGLDEDNNGSDLDCPEPDKDNDGYLSTNDSNGNDCDDHDYKIYPGVITNKGCAAGETRECLQTGSFTACTNEIICEASAGSTCKYIDCQNGSDSMGDGSFNSPWKSFKMVGGYDSAATPANWYQVKPGDVIYLKGNGVCNDTYSPDPLASNTVIYVKTSGTILKPITYKRYPGDKAVIDPPFTSSFQGNVVRANNVSNIKFDDLEITDSYSAVFYLTDTSNFEVSRVKCHDSNGSTFDNVACINAAGEVINNYYHHNEFFNLYDSDRPGRENVAMIVFFKGYNNRVEYNRLYYSNDPNYGGQMMGRCFKYKHPGEVGTLTFKGNQLWNCLGAAVENSTAGVRMHNNLFVNPDSYSGASAYLCGDIGSGTSFCKDAIIENNTFINFRPISFRFSINSGLGTTNVRNNIFIDNSPIYNTENGFYRIERYGNDAEFQTFLNLPALISNNNCFYNQNTDILFDLFGDSPETTGNMYNFMDWKTFGFDANSRITNPLLDSYNRATSIDCIDKGWLVLASSTTSSTTTTTTLTSLVTTTLAPETTTSTTLPATSTTTTIETTTSTSTTSTSTSTTTTTIPTTTTILTTTTTFPPTTTTTTRPTTTTTIRPTTTTLRTTTTTTRKTTTTTKKTTTTTTRRITTTTRKTTTTTVRKSNERERN